mmetsp:Transcript_44011/g.121886  ORF Transcript_44011/g.121886 Transcript_44011/m.121886 type:complete len:232 (+) Transcript_44011:303-998(+)
MASRSSSRRRAKPPPRPSRAAAAACATRMPPPPHTRRRSGLRPSLRRSTRRVASLRARPAPTSGCSSGSRRRRSRSAGSTSSRCTCDMHMTMPVREAPRDGVRPQRKRVHSPSASPAIWAASAAAGDDSRRSLLHGVEGACRRCLRNPAREFADPRICTFLLGRHAADPVSSLPLRVSLFCCRIARANGRGACVEYRGRVCACCLWHTILARTVCGSGVVIQGPGVYQGWA